MNRHIADVIARGFETYAYEARKEGDYPNCAAITYPALGLASEVGEVCGKIQKSIRDHGFNFSEEMLELITKELGDCLWFMALLARDLGIAFSDVAVGNIEKVESRVERGVIQGSGDNR